MALSLRLEGHLHFSPSSLASGGAGALCSLHEELVGGADWPAGWGVYSYLFSVLLHGMHLVFVFVFMLHNYS